LIHSNSKGISACRVEWKYMPGCLKIGFVLDLGCDAKRRKEATFAVASEVVTWSTMYFRKMERKAARAAPMQQAPAFKACGGTGMGGACV